MSDAAQRSTILNLQIPINHGRPNKPLGFTFCRLRYQTIRFGSVFGRNWARTR